MGTIIAFLMTKGLSAKLARAAAYAGLALLLCGALAGLVAAYNHRIIANHDVRQIQRAAPATDQAATERAKDTIAQAKNEQEMHDVIAAQPDQPIAPTSHARACLQLRRAGKHSASCK